MIIADIKGKLPELQNWEDYLTSCVFSTFNYLPSTYLEQFLKTAHTIDNISFDITIENPRFDFWPRFEIQGNCTEPDVVIKTQKATIIIEAKFYSGKSGVGIEDEEIKSQQEGQEEIKGQLVDQLAREYFVGKQQGRNFFVIFITIDPVIPKEDIRDTLEAIKEIENEKEAQDAKGRIFWTRWHHIGPIMEKIIKEDNNKTYQSLIAKDLLEFLNRRGLNLFKGFGFLSDYLAVLKNIPMQSIFYKDYSPKYWLWLEDVKSKQIKIDKDIFYSKGGEQK